MSRIVSIFLTLLFFLLAGVFPAWGASRVPALTGPGETSSFLVDPAGALAKILARTKNGVTTRYVYGAGLQYEVNAAGEATYYHYDMQGNTAGLTNQAGALIDRILYTPYGSIRYRMAAHDTPFLFGGFFGIATDGNGLVHMRARYYNPLTMRFLNSDPALDGWNWYAYANGNPMSYADPTGYGANSVLNAMQTGLGMLGFVPGLGAVADVLNADISATRGDYLGASMSLVSAVPGIGDAFAAGRIARSTTQVARISHTTAPVISAARVENTALNSLPIPGVCFVAGTDIETEVGGRKIESLRVGERVLTTDGDSCSEVDPASWRKVTLRMPNPECPSDTLELELLRSTAWMVSTSCQPGTRMWFELEEMGLQGWADVQSVSDCPAIRLGRGRVVLATVTHYNTFVMEVRLEGQSELLRPTDRHRLFSITRNDWVPTKSLQPGEELRTATGLARISSVQPLPGTHQVYNIEVETEHSYFAGKAKVLCHNANPCAAKDARKNKYCFLVRKS